MNALAREISACNSLLLNKEYAEAETCFRQAATITGQLNESLIGVAIALYELNNYRGALNTLNSVDENSYKDPKLPFWKAKSHRMLRNYDTAIHYFAECISDGNEEISIEAYRLRGLTTMNKILLTQYPRTNKKGLPFPFSIDEIGDKSKIEKIRQNLKEAEKDFFIYGELKKSNSNVCFEIALANYLLGEKESSLHNFETCIESKTNIQASHYMIGIIYQDNAKHTEAIRLFTESIQMNKNHARSLYHRAISYIELGEKESALADLEAAIKIDNNESYQKMLWELRSKNQNNMP
jgi:tetratricopeptide (TPR) repeat protein